MPHAACIFRSSTAARRANRSSPASGPAAKPPTQSLSCPSGLWFLPPFCAHSVTLLSSSLPLSNLSTVLWSLGHTPHHDGSHCSSCFCLSLLGSNPVPLVPQHPRKAGFSALVGRCVNTSGPLTHPCSPWNSKTRVDWRHLWYYPLPTLLLELVDFCRFPPCAR